MSEEPKFITMNAKKLLDILMSMLERSWKNEMIMAAAIKDFSVLFKNMQFTRENYNEFLRINDTLLLDPVTWDEYIAEFDLQKKLGGVNETTND